MIKFLNKNNSIPYSKLRNYYQDALTAKQPGIEAISISSFNKNTQEVNSRLVNLKFIDDEEFIFFSNYDSPKSIEFASHNQISAILYWSKINLQIRLKGKIKKKSRSFNINYFKSRLKEKNALAISSNQSNPISSFDEVVDKYNYTRLNSDLTSCPINWGGFFFRPYNIEFWKGGDFRLNKRDLYEKNNEGWAHSVLEP